MDIKLKARAKLNLTLNVTGMHDSVYHSLSSVITSIDVADTVKVEMRFDDKIIVTVDGKLDKLNVANRVATAIRNRFGKCGVNINVDKGIAVMGGMGGSSVDAAATIFAMSNLYGVPIDSEMMKLAADFGSDIAYMIRGGLAIATGKGDDIRFVPDVAPYYYTVINGPRLSTTDVFAEYDRCPDYTRYDDNALLTALSQGNIAQARNHLGNNLQPAAARLSGTINNIFTACSQLALPTPTMTGSGGNFFILCKNVSQAKKYAEKLQTANLTAYAASAAKVGLEVL